MDRDGLEIFPFQKFLPLRHNRENGSHWGQEATDGPRACCRGPWGQKTLATGQPCHKASPSPRAQVTSILSSAAEDTCAQSGSEATEVTHSQGVRAWARLNLQEAVVMAQEPRPPELWQERERFHFQ